MINVLFSQTPTPPPPTISWATLTPFPTTLPGDIPITNMLGTTDFELTAQRAVQAYAMIPTPVIDLIMGFILLILVVGLLMLIANEFGET